MITYVNTVFVSNVDSSNVVTALANVSKGKFIFWDIDANDAITANTVRFKIGMGTGKTISNDKGSMPEIRWSNIINVDDIKGWSVGSYAADTEDTAYIDLSGATGLIGSGKLLSQAGKRIIVRLTYKDMPHRYRKWTESYEYITHDGETAATMATGIANMINKEWKRARVQASASAGVLTLVALPYDDDDAVDTLNVANKVRFNTNIYWTDPQAEGWESKNKHFPAGVEIDKTPGKTYPASAKLVRDREAWSMGYLGILNRGEGTWPIIKPDMETQLDKHYDAITLEFENMYRAADDIQRKTKQVLEVYAVKTTALQAVLNAFVNGVTPTTTTNP